MISLRPPTAADGEPVLAVMVARDIADIGRPDVRLQDVVGDWSAPDIDPLLDCFVADDDGAVVGYAVVDAQGATALVDPDAEGRGIGTTLRRAVEDRARERGQPIRQMVYAGSAGVAHLEAAGYRPMHFYQRLRAPLDVIPQAPPVVTRVFDLEADAPEVHALIELAFSEIEGNTPEPYESWRSRMAARTDPAFRLALDDEEGLVAVATGERWQEECSGYVAHLAVAPRARGRGHGRNALLAMLAAFRDAGLGYGQLAVHGTNMPALGLYESLGMSRDFRQEVWGR